MTGMIAEFLAWPTLGVALLVFGFAPGVVLRLLVLFYRRGNPRRQELLGELYAIPRIERPFWVAEQLEVALFEGLRDRFSAGLNRSTRRADHPLTVRKQIKRQLERDIDRYRDYIALRNRGIVQLAESDDPFGNLLADDISRGWRGRGWRGTQPEMPPTDFRDPNAGV